MYDNNSQEGCFVMVLMWGITLAVSILTGIWAWNLVEPESFFGAVGFILFWGLTFRIILSIVGAILSAIFN